MTPFPSFPQIQSADLGEGECDVFMNIIISWKVKALRELQSTSGEELRPFVGRTLMPSVLDRAFKGEL